MLQLIVQLMQIVGLQMEQLLLQSLLLVLILTTGRMVELEILEVI